MSEVKFKRGSEWRKWDLHLHSPYTKLNNQFENISDEDFIEKIKVSNIEVIGLTNYFKFDDKEFELKNKLEKEGITVFLNLELRLTYQNKENNNCDFHIVFSNDLSKEDINSFLSNLTLKIGGKQKKANTLSSEEYFKNATVEYDTLLETLNENPLNLKDKYFTGFLSRGCGNSRSSTQYEPLVKKSHFLIHSSDSQENIEKDRDFWLNHQKPLLQSSDAHKLDDIGNKFTWIKADPTFEGLKQIIHEPESRVRIQETKPEDKAGYQIIDSIKIKNHNGFTNQTIYFNENLNCIIGGRSTGKSILLGTIAKKLNVKRDVKENNLDYINFIEEVKEKSTITWKDNETDDNRGLEYIPQSYMHDIARDRKKFNKLINGIIKQDTERKKQLEIYTTSEGDNKTTINNDVNKLIQLQGKLLENKETLKATGDKTGIEEEIKKLNEQLSQLKTTLPAEAIKEYNKLKNNLENLTNENKNLEVEISKIRSLKNKSFINSNIELDISSLNEINKKDIKTIFDTIKKEFEEKWSNELEKIIVNNNNNIIDSNKDEIKEFENKEIFKKGNKFSEENKQYKEIEEKLKIEKEKLNEVTNFEKNIAISKTNIDSLKGTIKNNHKEFYTKINELAKELKVANDNLKISASVKLQNDKLKEYLSDNINLQSHDNKEIVNKEFTENNNFENYFAHTSDLFDELQNKTITLKQYKEHHNILRDLMSTNYFEISYDITYEKDNFNKMSEGKKAFVVLKLLLDFSTETSPILIDQPEDDLDNRTIYKDLVKYLKQKKTTRQIIVVTHNPNIVVGADAENIIVANQHGTDSPNTESKKFQYTNGSLENTKSKDEKNNIILESQGIREHVCEILEGGNEAFKKRENKYNLN